MLDILCRGAPSVTESELASRAADAPSYPARERPVAAKCMTHTLYQGLQSVCHNRL